jgi:arginase
VAQKATLTTAIGAPIDCTGRFTGVERMPVALRAAGLMERLKLKDAGDLPVIIDSPERDPHTGIIGFQSICRSSEIIRREVGQLLSRSERPLVVGGCCTLLIGVFAALRDQYGNAGLAFVDGHLDFYDGASSPTGEAADMELAILTGLGPAGLVDLAGSPPLAQPQDIVVLGYRDAEHARQEGSPDPEIVVPEMKLFDVKAVRQLGPAALGRQTAERFEKASQRFWLHLDLDVLDQAALPAVDYLMPDGLSWEALAELARPLAHSPALLGADVTIYNPALDTDGRYARRIVALLAEVFL